MQSGQVNWLEMSRTSTFESATRLVSVRLVGCQRVSPVKQLLARPESNPRVLFDTPEPNARVHELGGVRFD